MASRLLLVSYRVYYTSDLSLVNNHYGTEEVLVLESFFLNEGFNLEYLLFIFEGREGKGRCGMKNQIKITGLLPCINIKSFHLAISSYLSFFKFDCVELIRNLLEYKL